MFYINTQIAAIPNFLELGFVKMKIHEKNYWFLAFIQPLKISQK